ncbi:MAG: hypothetical protein WD711_10170 [Dongiaceae bacterium]
MKSKRPTRGLALAAAMVLTAFSSPLIAQAQSSAPPLTVSELRYCICQQQRIEAVRPELDTLRAMVNERQASLVAHEAQIAQLQQTVSPDDWQGQDQIKRSIYETNLIRDLLRRDLTPNYLAVTRSFNELVNGYNEYCANRRMVASDVAEANSDLRCAAEAPDAPEDE